MTAPLIDGKAIAAEVEAEAARDVAAIVAGGLPAPSLHVVLCGDDPASASYVAGKERACGRVGIRTETHRPPPTSSTEDLLTLLSRLSADSDVDAILVQLPLPPQIDRGAVLLAVAPEKDVDGFNPINFGLLAEGNPRVAPCTPVGCMELLRRTGVAVRGARAVVVGRSVIVGRPMAALLTIADATVTVCHSRTADLPGVCREADILVTAMGRPGMVDGGWVKPGACVIDVGLTRVDGRLRGDVDRATVEPVAGWLTPVPGGVGPMTIATLLRNTLALAGARRGRPVGASAG